jgi:hypothetical protein
MRSKAMGDDYCVHRSDGAFIRGPYPSRRTAKMVADSLNSLNHFGCMSYHVRVIRTMDPDKCIATLDNGRAWPRADNE